MHRLLAKLLIVLFLAPAAFALEFNAGFYAADSDEVPAAVRAQIPYIYNLKVRYFAPVQAKSYDPFLASEKIPAETAADLRVCKERGLPSCWVHFDWIQGTAFLDEDGGAIWTNCHMVYAWIEYRKQQLLLAGAEGKLFHPILVSDIPLEGRDLEGRVLFDSASAGARVEAAEMNPFSSNEDVNCSRRSDAVKIRLATQLAPQGISRKIRTLPLQPGEPLYVGGFPSPTESRAALGKGDSLGHTFHWTFGPHIAKSEMPAHFGKENPFSLAVAGPYTEPFLGDSAVGQSGSPVFDRDGNLMGIFTSYVNGPGAPKTAPPVMSLMLTSDGMKYIEIYSQPSIAF